MFTFLYRSQRSSFFFDERPYAPFCFSNHNPHHPTLPFRLFSWDALNKAPRVKLNSLRSTSSLPRTPSSTCWNSTLVRCLASFSLVVIVQGQFLRFPTFFLCFFFPTLAECAFGCQTPLSSVARKTSRTVR
ncbi:hypothetical protein BCR44DRAFT_1427641 [Catenaria anguillulae PL171]|uniref:Uncharacterized protein n=1 Tax=Catenaria anguillulae PL171 TaxID=765915 RepID=A0A1Y2HY77_9FUNG|nr:hypothetical protein BCR44DRAFT_1427641 [Catenaria anguillulae PL171]